MQSSEIDELKRSFKDLQERLSKARKKGLDTTILNIKMYSVAPKIQLAEVTLVKSDIEIAKKAIAELNAELKAIEG